MNCLQIVTLIKRAVSVFRPLELILANLKLLATVAARVLRSSQLVRSQRTQVRLLLNLVDELGFVRGVTVACGLVVLQSGELLLLLHLETAGLRGGWICQALVDCSRDVVLAGMVVAAVVVGACNVMRNGL